MIEILISVVTAIAKMISLVLTCATYVALSRRLERVERQSEILSNAPSAGLNQCVTVTPPKHRKPKQRFLESRVSIDLPTSPWMNSCKRPKYKRVRRGK